MVSTVKPISSAPFSAATKGSIPFRDGARYFPSPRWHHQPRIRWQMVIAMSERLSRLYPNRYITAKVPTSETGTATPGMRVARPVAQENKDDQDDEADGNEQRPLDITDRGADGGGAIKNDE